VTTSPAAPADAVPGDLPGRRDGRGWEKSSRVRLLADDAATWVVGAGGIAVVASILGILAFLVVEVVPLFAQTRVTPGREIASEAPAPVALRVDEHRTHAAALGSDGVLRVYSLASGALVREVPVTAAALLGGQARSQSFVAASGDGQILILPLSFQVGFEGQTRVVSPVLGEPVILEIDPSGAPLGAYAAAGGAGGSTGVAQLADGELVLLDRQVEENLFTGETTAQEVRSVLSAPAPLRSLEVDDERRNVYGITDDGRLLWWSVSAGRAGEPRLLSQGTSAATAMRLLIGQRSLVVGREDGSIEVWAQVLTDEGGIQPRFIRSFPPHDAPIHEIVVSDRNRSFLVQDEAGGLGLYYSTSDRTLWRGQAPLASAAAYAPKGDALVLAGPSGLVEWDVENAHPEASLSTFFEKVWYEGYRQPEYVWQSTGGSDDFESKLSLTPLLFGTLKATLYSMLLAVPLAVLAAIYTAQFMHPRLARVVKPSIEIMASLPSVVLGFLAGLWLAPRLETAFPGLILVFVAFPLTSILTGMLWAAIPQRIRGRLREGSDILLHAVMLLIALVACFQLSGAVEAGLFGGDFPAWLRAHTGLAYEQRNAVVVGIAMGFAVIPIIFAISEDALSNVPRDLVAGSLALGADRWQTVVRVVLPTASPGIFSAIMVGFGRAIGETMIVLMATGNTPIMDWSAFNGFRTLSANIAVEIPEAPVGSTLYRTLFIAAILLFAVTFVINTVAEVVRQHLRSRYARL
jgi:phosphate transport system permease protein